MTALQSHPLAGRISAQLPPSLRTAFRICAADEVTSTNTVLKEAAAAAIAEGTKIIPTVLLARRQSGGRGRMGRSFHSPDGTGLYMSVLLTPDIRPCDAALLTTAAAVACAEACDSVRGDADGTVGIKWVNDLYLGDKKFCGILAEAALTPTADAFSWAVIGIGINLLPPTDGFPDAIANTACALFDELSSMGMGMETDDVLSRLCADITVQLTHCLAPSQRAAVLNLYRRRSILDGRAVLVRPASSLGGAELPAVVTGISDDFGLCVRYENGEEAVLSSGEVVLSEGDRTVQSARASVHLQ